MLSQSNRILVASENKRDLSWDIYLDESGSENNTIMLVGGWVSLPEQFAALSKHWETALGEFGVDHFHSHSFRNARDPKYRHLKKFQRDELLIRLIGLIKTYAVFGQAVWVKPKTYNRLTTSNFRSRHGSAYASLLGYVVGHVGIFVTGGLRHEAKVSVYLEEGHANAVEAVQYVNQYKVISTTPPEDVEIVGPIGNHGLRFTPFKIGTVSLGSKQQMMALQAADMLAYCSLCLLRNSNDRFAKSILAGIDLPIHLNCFDDEAISKFIEVRKQSDAEEVKLLHHRRVQQKQLTALGISFQVLPDGILAEVPDNEELRNKVKEILASTGR